MNRLSNYRTQEYLRGKSFANRYTRACVSANRCLPSQGCFWRIFIRIYSFEGLQPHLLRDFRTFLLGSLRGVLPKVQFERKDISMISSYPHFKALWDRLS